MEIAIMCTLLLVGSLLVTMDWSKMPKASNAR